jgi:hypothetical protein
MVYLLVDPNSKLNFSFDWTDWLASGSSGSPTDTIASRQWSISPSGGSPQPTLTGDTTDVVFVEGLEAGKIYALTEHVVTAAGIEDDRTIVLRCEET